MTDNCKIVFEVPRLLVSCFGGAGETGVDRRG